MVDSELNADRTPKRPTREVRLCYTQFIHQCHYVRGHVSNAETRGHDLASATPPHIRYEHAEEWRISWNQLIPRIAVLSKTVQENKGVAAPVALIVESDTV